MFTGIVEARGRITAASPGVLWVSGPGLDKAALGASVAVDGVCLTVAAHGDGACRFDVSHETLERTTLGRRRPGDEVNIERPLRAGSEMGGHVVQGHVDGVGAVVRADDEGDGRRLGIQAPPHLMRYVVEKGSVTVDGVSLTVTGMAGDTFETACVPHTLRATTLGFRGPGDAVNLEVDILAKYVERLLTFAAAIPGQQNEQYL
ncbi:MAG TPA: riboflavin synthase [Actinomycetota bacterium]|nr:riboflavin synthase [Actinomycetota bacterium]